jgi:hypothetical protein
MESFKKFIKTDLLHKVIKTSLEDARKIGIDMFSEYGRDFDIELPNFNVNYGHSRKLIIKEQSQRQHLPKLTPLQIKEIQKELANGYANYEKNSFPHGQVDRFKQKWISFGVEINGKKANVEKDVQRAFQLKPSQYQIFIEPAMKQLAKKGSELAMETIWKSTFIITKDNYILDGHDRWLGGFWINKNIKVNCFRLDIELKDIVG